MKISWLGHSCFYLQSSKGISLLTDPFDEEVGYKLPRVRADIVVVSHDHHDHNNIVGGIYTLDAKEAWTVIEQLHPRIAIPMHYFTPDIRFGLDGVEEFLKGRDFCGPLKSFEAVLEDRLQEKSSRVVLLDYVHSFKDGSID